MNRFIKTGISIAAAVAITASASAMALAANYMGDVNDDGKVIPQMRWQYSDTQWVLTAQRSILKKPMSIPTEASILPTLLRF